MNTPAQNTPVQSPEIKAINKRIAQLNYRAQSCDTLSKQFEWVCEDLTEAKEEKLQIQHREAREDIEIERDRVEPMTHLEMGELLEKIITAKVQLGHSIYGFMGAGFRDLNWENQRQHLIELKELLKSKKHDAIDLEKNRLNIELRELETKRSLI
jgi:hypothetical protein